MIRKIVLIFLILGAVLVFYTSPSNTQVINNSASGQVGADSLSLPFWVLDSLGNMTTLATNDSVFLVVFYPDGSVAFTDGDVYNGTSITSQALSSFTVYAWADAGANLDGASAPDGAYSYIVVVKDSLNASSSGTPFRGTFQLFTARDYNVALDLASDTSLYITGSDMLDSLRWAQGVGIGAFSFTVRTPDEDSLFFGVNSDTLWIKIYQNKLSGNPTTKVVAYSER